MPSRATVTPEVLPPSRDLLGRAFRLRGLAADEEGVRRSLLSRRRLVGLAASLIVVLVPLSGSAAQPATTNAPSADVWRDYQHVLAEEVRLYDQLAASRAEEQRLATRRAELDGHVAALQTRLVEARAALERADAELATGRQRLDAVERRLADERTRLRNQAVSAYMGGGKDEDQATQMLALLRSNTASEVQSGRVYAGSVLDRQLGTVDMVTELERQARALAQELARIANAAAKARDDIAAQEGFVRAARDETERLRSEAATLAEGQRALLAQLQGRKVVYEQRLFAMDRASDGFTALLRQVQRGQVLQDPLPVVRSPVERSRIESGFGMRTHPLFGDTRLHAGVDIHGDQGQVMVAAGDGVVVLAGEQQGYGLVTVVDHGGQVATVYAHQSRIEVTVGQRITRGQRIGLVGSTGYSTGPHVHFEYRVGGAPIDPAPFVDLDELLPETCRTLAASTKAVDRDLAAARAECRTALAPVAPR